MKAVAVMKIRIYKTIHRKPQSNIIKFKAQMMIINSENKIYNIYLLVNNGEYNDIVSKN